MSRLTKRLMRGEFKRAHKMRIIDPDQDKGSPSNDEINQLVEQARGVLFVDIMGIASPRTSVPMTITYDANREFILLPSDMRLRKVTTVRGVPSGNTNSPVPLTAMVPEEFINLSQYGTPGGYAVLSDRLYLRPIPTVDWDLTFSLARSLTKLADEQYPEELPDEFHHLPPQLAVVRYRREVNMDPGGMAETVEEDRRLLREVMEELYPDTRRVHEVEALEDLYE